MQQVATLPQDKYRKSFQTHQRSASYQPQVVYTAPAATTQTSRPALHHQPASFMAAPSSHANNRYAFVTTAPNAAATTSPMVMVPSGTSQYITTTGMTPVRSQFPAVQRIQRESSSNMQVVPQQGGASSYRPSRSASSDTAMRHVRSQAVVPSTPYMPRRSGTTATTTAVDSDSGTEDEAYTMRTTSGYGAAGIPSVPRIISSTNTGGSNAPRPIMRKRTTSTASAASVHFTPDNIFLTFPSPHTIKLANIPKFGSNALMRAIREKVITMWLPGITFQKEGRGEYIVGFAGLAEGAVHHPKMHENGLSESDRKNWGLWTARGGEGVAALRLLRTMFVTFAAQGYSYLASLHCLPPQLIFTSTPADPTARFLALEVTVTPLQRRKQKVAVSDPDTGDFIMEKKVKVDISHVGVRCVDFPDDVLRAVVGAIRNTGREGAGINTSKPKRPTGEKDEADSKSGAAASELLEFGVQGECWDMKGVYRLDSLISRGTGKRAVSRKEMARARADKQMYPNLPEVIEADTDTLPVLLSHILRALSQNGYRLESSVPLPLPVPLVDPFSPFGSQHTHSGGFVSFINGVLGNGADTDVRGHGREVWMFRSVNWFEDDD